MKAKVFVKALLHLLLLLDVSAAAAFRGKAGSVVKAYKRAPLQDIVRHMKPRILPTAYGMKGHMGRAFTVRAWPASSIF